MDKSASTVSIVKPSMFNSFPTRSESVSHPTAGSWEPAPETHPAGRGKRAFREVTLGAVQSGALEMQAREMNSAHPSCETSLIRHSYFQLRYAIDTSFFHFEICQNLKAVRERKRSQRSSIASRMSCCRADCEPKSGSSRTNRPCTSTT